MLRNYLKMAINVLFRRKFYTFISMFGISITLAILLIVTAFWEHTTGEQAPEVNLDRSLVVTRMEMRGKADWSQVSAASYYFLDKYVRQMKTPEMTTFYSLPSTVNTFLEEKRVKMDRKFTDANFWKVMKFDFIEGRPYTQEDLDRRQAVAVVNQSIKEELFGKGSALGKEIKIDKERFKVIGVVKNVSFSRIHTTGDLYLPVSLSKGYGIDKGLLGEYIATLVAKSPEHRKEVQQEYAALMKHVENPDPERIASISSNADTYLGGFTRMAFGGSDDPGVKKLYIVLFTFAFLFMLLPTVNLVNINLSRTLERASEIGVRKAFGASSYSLVIQFVFENLVLTLICGMLAVGLAYLALLGINEINMIPHMVLTLNFQVLLIGLIFTIIFGLISGVYPAWRMSRLQAAEALKGR